MTFWVKCSNNNYKLLYPYNYPTNHTQAGATSVGMNIYINRIKYSDAQNKLLHSVL